MIPEWQEDTPCRRAVDAGEADINWWFDERPEAKAICDRCPVRVECRKWGRRHGEPFMYGGETAKERSRPDVPEPDSPVCPGSIRRYIAGCRCRLCTDKYATRLAHVRAYKERVRERAS